MSESMLTLTTKDGPMDAFVVEPDGAKAPLGVVVVQEAFGVNAHIKDVARRFAAEGFTALAPEFFHRSGRGVNIPYGDFEKARPMLATLSNAGLESDLDAAIGELEGRVPGGRVAVVGFCLGGFVAFLAACRTRVATAVSFYGGIARQRPGSPLVPLLDEAETIQVPVLLFFGDEDQAIARADVDAIEGRLRELGKEHEVVVYPGAGHAFFCDQRPSYRPEAAADAWVRTLGWLRKV
jgi:carboxymethylenebutenolidase